MFCLVNQGGDLVGAFVPRGEAGAVLAFRAKDGAIRALVDKAEMQRDAEGYKEVLDRLCAYQDGLLFG